jgi:hypothetical protein
MANKLYYGSLQKHMKEYMKNVKLQDLNNQYQVAQAKIVREGEAMQLSRAEIQNRIEMMKQTLKDNIAQKLLPPEKVAPVAPVVQDQYKPMTTSDYENALRKRFKDQILIEFPEVPIVKTKEERKQTVDAILNLYKDKPTSTELIEALTNEIKSTALAKQQQKDMNKKLNITQLEQEVKRNFDEISKNRKVSDALQDEILRSLNNLKPVKIIQKVKTKSPFQQELEQKINESNLRNAANLRNADNRFVNKNTLMDKPMKNELEADLKDRKLTRFAKKSIIPSPAPSSQATTASTTSSASNIQSIKQPPGTWLSEKNRFINSEVFKTLPQKEQDEIKNKKITKARIQAIKNEYKITGDGLRKKRK